jgi:predicted nucleic acid-binding protein
VIVAPAEPPEIVLDASVLAKWFRTEVQRQTAAARRLRRRYTQGELAIMAPALLYLEMLNIAARRWRWPARRVAALAGRLKRYGFTIDEPPPERVAHWSGKGLTAYDACYLALAEHRRCVLVTADDQLSAAGGRFVRSL